MRLELKNISKSYDSQGTKLDILKNLNLDVAQGKIVAIVGQSGSGKTTLLSLLAGLDSVDAGSILYDGNNISEMNEVELTRFRAENMSIVFQQFHLMPYLNALENVMLPLEILKRSEAESLAKVALEQVGLGSRLHHFPSQLSGGESQRVAIARAFVTQPKFLLADEPSGNLDNKTGEEVMSLLFNQVKRTKTTLILVTHNQELSKLCDEEFRLEKGTLHSC